METPAILQPSPHPSLPVPTEEEVDQLEDRLASLGMMDDVDSRETIMSELRNPDQRVRNAALEAIIQFGDRSVVPRLQALADETRDDVEKQAIMEAIGYIKLPSLTEIMNEEQAGSAGSP